MKPTGTQCAAEAYTVHIPPIGLAGTLCIPAGAIALVVFAHGSGLSRRSPRNMAVAEGLNEQGIATLLFDLLTLEEEVDRANVFDIRLLALKTDQVRRMKALEAENARLRRAVSDLTLDKMILAEAAKGNF